MSELRDELRDLLNRASRENVSNTPDRVLAQYLMSCLRAYEAAVLERDRLAGVNMLADKS